MICYNFLILTFILTACTATPKHIELTNRAISLFSNEVYRTNKLQLAGSGGALFKNIKTFALSFSLEKNLGLVESRKLFVNIAERFLTQINSDESIRPFLNEYPINIKNLDLSISFEIDNKFVSPNYIAYISVPNINPDRPTDFIYYSIYDPNLNKLINIHKESYIEALKIVYEQE